MRDNPFGQRLPRLVMEGLGHLAQGITVFDADLRLVAWNAQFLETLGYPPDLAFEGADFASFIRFNALRGEYGPGDPEAQVAERVAVARRFEKHQVERRRPDGSVIQVTGTPLPSGGFVTTYTDVTAVRRQEERLQVMIAQRTLALQASEARLKLIADEVPAGIAHIDRDMKILYANKRFAHAYGLTPEQMIGLRASDVLHPRTLRESARFFEQARRGSLVDFEMRVELPGGQMKDIRTLLRPEAPSAGEVIGFYLLSIDVTRRKATMSALMRSQKMDALGRMASGISHDFNNLLTIILGNLGPLQDQLGEGELCDEYLRPAIAAARRGSSLTQRLLGLARREQFDPQPTDIDAAVSEICSLLRSSLPQTLELVQRRHSDLPRALVDQAQLEMALLNLALNARDATGGRGRIVIEADPYALPLEEAEMLHLPVGDYVRLRFSDDGCGMGADHAERIFEPFFTSKAAGAGSGLGLSMVYGFVKQSNGAISLETAPGAGTVFTILLPGVGIGEPVAPAAHEPEPVQEGGEVLVLLVEDDAEVRRTIRRKLTGLGYPLIEAADGDAALSLLQRLDSIGLVLSDIEMPGSLDGVQLARRIRDGFPAVAVALMSGKAGSARAMAEAGLAVPFLQKPFSPTELAAALTQALDAVERRG
ncbi:PAS-domain containing protein [Gemmobacter aquatilis]|nr:PAS-domain containing protein [Gemmobacter aquatilis]